MPWLRHNLGSSMKTVLLLTEQNLNAICLHLTHDTNVRSEKITPPFLIFYRLWCNMVIFFFCVKNDKYRFWHICFTVKKYLAYKWKKSSFDRGLKKSHIAKFTFFRKVSFVWHPLEICLELIKFSCHVNSGDLKEIYLITLGENISFCVSS